VLFLPNLAQSLSSGDLVRLLESRFV
jgi:hypothetical protein